MQFTLALDYARGETVTGTLPGSVVITNGTLQPLNRIEVTFGFFFGDVLADDPGWSCSKPPGVNAALVCRRNEPLAPQSEVTLEYTLRFTEKAGRTFSAINSRLVKAARKPGTRWRCCSGDSPSRTTAMQASPRR